MSDITTQSLCEALQKSLGISVITGKIELNLKDGILQSVQHTTYRKVLTASRPQVSTTR